MLMLTSLETHITTIIEVGITGRLQKITFYNKGEITSAVMAVTELGYLPQVKQGETFGQVNKCRPQSTRTHGVKTGQFCGKNGI